MLAPMSYALYVRFDETGARPVLLRDHETLDGGEGVRYRYVTTTAGWEEADAIRVELRRRIEARELQS